MDVLITVKVDQADALQTIMDLQALGYALAGFDVGSVVVPLAKVPAKATRNCVNPKWQGHTKVRLTRIVSSTRMRSGHVLVPALKDIGIGWEGTYDQLKTELAKRIPGAAESTIRANAGYIKNAGCLEVIA